MLEGRSQGNKAVFGDSLTAQQINKLGAAPNPAQIFESMDDLNEEIKDSWSGMIGEGTTLPKILGSPPKPKRNINSKTVKAKQPNKPEIKVRANPSLEDRTMPERKMEKNVSDLLSALDDIVAKEETPEEIEAAQHKRLLDLLAKLPDGPTEAKLNFWKSQHGKDGLHATVFSEKEVYVYTHLTRAMWTKVQETLSKLQSTKNTVGEEELKETVVKHCMLYPSLTPEWKYNSRAGVVDSLYQAISLHSYFLTPQQIMSLTFEL